MDTNDGTDANGGPIIDIQTMPNETNIGSQSLVVKSIDDSILYTDLKGSDPGLTDTPPTKPLMYS